MDTSSIVIITRLKAPDPVELTAFRCLTGSLDYAGILTRLNRHEYWKIQFYSSIDAPYQTGMMLARETKIFVNPNKHTYRVIRNNNENGRDVVAIEKDIFRVHLTVVPFFDTAGENALRLLHSLYELKDTVHSLVHGTLWTLDLRAAGRKDAREKAMDIAVSRSRRKGLLANPHAQIISFIALAK